MFDAIASRRAGKETVMAKEYAGRQMHDLVETARPDITGPEAAPEAEAPVRRSAAPVTVGAADDRAEAEADAMASRVLARLAAGPAAPHSHGPDCGHDGPVQRSYGGGRPAIGAEGGALSAEAEADLASSRGGGAQLDPDVRRTMEAGFGQPLPAGVRVHTDQRAGRLADQMGAVAFTHGTDIHFAAGAYAPDTAAGQHLLAHELTHVVQQRGGTTPSAQRKLRGTAQTLSAKGGGKTTKGARKVFNVQTNWDRIVGEVERYEGAEAALLKGGKNPSAATLSKAKPKLLNILANISAHIAKWREANTVETEQAEKRKRDKWATEQGDIEQADARTTKTDRWQALAQLEPRIGNEMALLTAADPAAWTRSLGLSDSQKTSTGSSAKGGVNTVQGQGYQLEDDQEFQGYFKAETDYIPMGVQGGLAHQARSGIAQHDPNFGARSVALYRLDQLLDAQVTARAEFAVSKDPKTGQHSFGTVLEAAKGKAANETRFVRNSAQTREAGQGSGVVNMEDPTLQRALNKLQLLDAISGQLDRHSGNYFIDANKDGSVNKVTGIDLDMSFGSLMKTTGKGSKDIGRLAQNYRGLPPYFDEVFALKILSVSEKDVEAAITGLLSKDEIAATVMRFREVQAALQAAKDQGKLVKKWDGSTAQDGRLSGSKALGGQQNATYRDDLDTATLFSNVRSRGSDGTGTGRLRAQLVEMIDRGASFAGRPASQENWFMFQYVPEVRELVKETLLTCDESAFWEPLAIAVHDLNLGPWDVEWALGEAFEAIVDDEVREKLMALVDDGTPSTDAAYAVLSPALARALKTFLAEHR